MKSIHPVTESAAQALQTASLGYRQAEREAFQECIIKSQPYVASTILQQVAS